MPGRSGGRSATSDRRELADRPERPPVPRGMEELVRKNLYGGVPRNPHGAADAPCRSGGSEASLVGSTCSSRPPLVERADLPEKRVLRPQHERCPGDGL